MWYVPALNHDHPPCGFFNPAKRFEEDANPIPILPAQGWEQHCVLAVTQQRYLYDLAGLFRPKFKTWTAWAKNFSVDRNRWAKTWQGYRWLTLNEVAWLNTLHAQAPTAWVNATKTNWQSVQALLTSPAGRRAQSAYAGKLHGFTTISNREAPGIPPLALLPDDHGLVAILRRATVGMAEDLGRPDLVPDQMCILVGADFDVTFADGLLGLTIPGDLHGAAWHGRHITLHTETLPGVTLNAPRETRVTRLVLDGAGQGTGYKIEQVSYN